MPKRIDLREGEALEIGGVAVAVAHARGKRAVLVIGGFDRDGLLETTADCRRYAKRLGEKIDANEPIGND